MQGAAEFVLRQASMKMANAHTWPILVTNLRSHGVRCCQGLRPWTES